MNDPETTALLKLVGWCAVIGCALLLIGFQLLVLTGLAFAVSDTPGYQLSASDWALVSGTYFVAPAVWVGAAYLMARSMRVFLWLSPLLFGILLMTVFAGLALASNS